MSTRTHDPEQSAEPVISLRDAVASSLSDDENVTTEDTSSIPVQAAKQASKLRAPVSERNTLRILFVTTDSDFLVANHPQQKHFADLAQIVSEVHIMLVRSGKKSPRVERPMSNVWIYHVYGVHPVPQTQEAVRYARDQLQFAGVVRPDVVVSLDPEVSGRVGYHIARLLQRPWQVHVSYNPWSAEWLANQSAHSQRTKYTHWTLKRARSVRVTTRAAMTALQARYKKITDVAVLPRRYHLESYSIPVHDDVHNRYRQFSFIMATEGSLQADSHLHEVITATHQLLRNQRVGLLILGTGSARELFREKVALLGIAHNVVFIEDEARYPAIYQSADVVIETGSDELSNERVLRAIAAGTAVITVANDFRNELLTDGQTARVMPAGDLPSLSQAVRELMNDRPARRRLAAAASELSQTSIHEDLDTFYRAYRDTIARTLVGGE